MHMIVERLNLLNLNRIVIKKAIEAREAFKEITNWENSLVTLEMMKFDKYGRILVKVYKNHIYINQWI